MAQESSGARDDARSGQAGTNGRDSLLAECDRFIDEHRGKADRGKHRARVATVLLIGAGAIIPVLLVASTRWDGFVLAKLLPSVVAAVSAVVAALVQVERPHERWRLYRRYQRLSEAERLKYASGLGDYSKPEADEHFARWLVESKIAVHDKWEGLLPQTESLVDSHRAPGGGP